MCVGLGLNMAGPGRGQGQVNHSLVLSERTPKAWLLARPFRHRPLGRLDPVRPISDGEPDAFAIEAQPAHRVSATARLPDGHDPQGLDGGQRVVVPFLVELPLALLEEVTARRVRVVWVRTGARTGRESAAESEKSVDKYGGANLARPSWKSLMKCSLLRTQTSDTPAEVQGQEGAARVGYRT